jgi:hypothetical protein
MANGIEVLTSIADGIEELISMEDSTSALIYMADGIEVVRVNCFEFKCPRHRLRDPSWHEDGYLCLL